MFNCKSKVSKEDLDALKKDSAERDRLKRIETAVRSNKRKTENETEEESKRRKLSHKNADERFKNKQREEDYRRVKQHLYRRAKLDHVERFILRIQRLNPLILCQHFKLKKVYVLTYVTNRTLSYFSIFIFQVLYKVF